MRYRSVVICKDMPIICPYSCSISSYTGFVPLTIRLWRNVKPTSQRRAVSPAALFSAAPDCRWRRWLSRIFARRHSFINIFVLWSTTTTTTIALCMAQARIPLWRHRCYMWYSYTYLSWVEPLCDIFLPVIQSQAVEEHDTFTTRVFRYRS